MEFRNCFYIFTNLLRFKLHDKNTMSPSGCIVHWRFSNLPICISNKKQVQSVFFWLGSMHWKVLKDKLTICCVIHLYRRQVFQFFSCMIFGQQIISIIVVNFQIWNVQRMLVSAWPFLKSFEDVRNWPRDNSTVLVSVWPSSNSKSLSRTSLSICKDRAIVTIESGINDIFRNLCKNLLLSYIHWQDSVILVLLNFFLE